MSSSYAVPAPAFHRSLREFYYPRLFPGLEFDRAELAELPQFSRNDADAPTEVASH